MPDLLPGHLQIRMLKVLGSRIAHGLLAASQVQGSARVVPSLSSSHIPCS